MLDSDIAVDIGSFDHHLALMVRSLPDLEAVVVKVVLFLRLMKASVEELAESQSSKMVLIEVEDMNRLVGRNVGMTFLIQYTRIV